MKKTCKICKDSKDIKLFHKFKDMKDGYRNECKVCKNKITSDYKKLKGREFNTVKSRVYRATNRAKILEYYGGVLTCEHCGLQDPIFSVYDFHHLYKSTKDRGIGQLINVGWDRIEAELKKCIVLCANCHRRVHYEENQETLKG